VRDVRFDCQRDKNHAPRALSLRANQILIAFGRHGITLHSLRCSSFLVCVGKEPVERSLFDASDSEQALEAQVSPGIFYGAKSI
jgi:hypothetical protein